MFRRLLGLLIIVSSLILIALLLGGAFYTGQAVDAAGDSIANILTITMRTLENVTVTLEQTRATISEANNALDTASIAALNLSRTMNNMQPVLESTTTVVTEDVPANIEAVQSTIPNITQVAGVIDGVLRRLSDFGISQTIPIPFNPITLEFDLGIDYEPDEPFDKTISDLGTSLEGMPEELRSLQQNLEVLSEDLEVLTGDIETASGDIERINEQVALFIPIIDEYLVITGQINDSMLDFQSQIFAQLETLKTALIIILIVMSLTQLAPLYLGWELFTEQRSPDIYQQSEPQEYPPSAPEDSVEGTETKAIAAGDMVEDEPAEELTEKPFKDQEAEKAEQTENDVNMNAVDHPSEAPTIIDNSSPAPESEEDDNLIE